MNLDQIASPLVRQSERSIASESVPTNHQAHIHELKIRPCSTPEHVGDENYHRLNVLKERRSLEYLRFLDRRELSHAPQIEFPAETC